MEEEEPLLQLMRTLLSARRDRCCCSRGGRLTARAPTPPCTPHGRPRSCWIFFCSFGLAVVCVQTWGLLCGRGCGRLCAGVVWGCSSEYPRLFQPRAAGSAHPRAACRLVAPPPFLAGRRSAPRAPLSVCASPPPASAVPRHGLPPRWCERVCVRSGLFSSRVSASPAPPARLAIEGGNHVPGASCELDCSWSFVFRARAWLVQLRCARAAGSHQHCVRDCLFFRCPRLLPVVHVCPSRCASGVAPRAPCTLMRLPRRRLRLGALARDGPSVGLRARLTCALCVCPGLAWAVCA